MDRGKTPPKQANPHIINLLPMVTSKNFWQSVITQWHKAHNENKEIIVLTDDNMDHNNNNFNNTYKINNIKEIN